MLDAQFWIKLRIMTLALPTTLCAPMLYFVTKYLVPKVVFHQGMEEVLDRAQGIDIKVIRPSAFPNQATRLAAVQHLLGENAVLPDEDPDFKNLNDDITKACVCRKCSDDGGAPSKDRDANLHLGRDVS